MFFDTVHLIKNIRNSLLNAKKFVFPDFSYNQGNIQLHCPQGYIEWADLYNIYDEDKELKGNLRMVYFTLFHLDLTSLISFDQYLAITSNAH